MKTKLTIACLMCMIILAGCMSAGQHASQVQEGLQGDRLTVGTVQREIRVGMSGGEVAQVLGSPNIVTTDEETREVWIYDRVATDRVYSDSSGGASALILGGIAGSGLAAGAGQAGYSSGAGAVSTSQRTLTVIIKFDREKKVRDFSYHSSRF